MPLYRVQVFKRIGANGKEWSNSYHVRAADLTGADGFAADIAAAEAAIHHANVEFVRYRVSTQTPGDNEFLTIPLNIFGARPVASSQLPLFNTVRVDFAVFGGRPSYKYLRLPIEETETADGQVQGPLAGIIETGYMVPLVSMSPEDGLTNGLVDEDGNGFTSASVKRQIQERQLRRRKRSSSGSGLDGS